MGTGPGRAYPHRIPLARLNGVSEKRVRELAGRLRPSREASDRDYNPLCPPPLRPDSRDERRLQSSLAFGSVGPTTRPQAHRPSFSNHRPHRAQVAAPLSTAGTARPPRTVWIITSMTPGDTISLGSPRARILNHQGHEGK